MTQGGMMTDEVFMPGGINQITITPPSPINWSWICTDTQWCGPGSLPRTVNSSGVAVYTARWNEQPGYSPTTTSCVTGDPIIDLIPARQMLDSLWKLAGGSGPDSLKKERGGYLFTDSTGVVDFRISNLDPNATACQTANTPSNIPPGGTLIASMHIHPFKDGDPTDVCHPTILGLTYNGHDNFGFSPKTKDKNTGQWGGDLYHTEEMVHFPAMAGMFIMDEDNIGFAPSGTTNKTIKQKGKRIPRINKNAGNCTVV